MTTTEEERSVRRASQTSDVKLERAGDYINALSAVVDRMPAAHEQDPEIERRRVEDLVRGLRTVADVMTNVIRDLEESGSLSEEFETYFKERSDEGDDKYEYCDNPTTLLEWILCTEDAVKALRRCWNEGESRHRFYWPGWQYNIGEIYDQIRNARDRFEDIDDQINIPLTATTRDRITGIAPSQVVLQHVTKSDVLAWDVQAKTTSFTGESETKRMYRCDATSGAITVTLPVGIVVDGYEVSVKKVDVSANAVIIDPSGGGTVDLAATATLASYLDAVHLIFDSATNDWAIT